MQRYEFLDHTADIGIRIFGKNPAELFQNAGCALFDSITILSKVTPKATRRFNLQRDCLEELLVEWLGSLLYVFDTELFLFSSFTVNKIDDNCLCAEARGEPFNKDIHIIKTAVKAVTYHNLSISKKNEICEAIVVLDV